MKEKLGKETGITLIALVITIIVLLILAGVSIAMLTGENGILTQAQKAKKETENAAKQEEGIITNYENYLSQFANEGFVENKGVNAPVLGENMELVTYNEETGNWDTNNSSSAYDYVEGEGTEDNNKSRWANARVTIDGIDSYFVWIPRYAYKITYKNKDNISEGATIEVKFLIGTTDKYYDDDGNLQTAKRAETRNEDTTSDYYVHPVFTNKMDLGGWKNEITGIWIGKYESSLVNKENQSNVLTNDEQIGNILLSENLDKAIAIQDGMSSWRYCTIGNMYSNAREYSKNLNSHMLKNSEWGAVAYLSWSEYGRNAHEININNSSEFITGSAGNSVNGLENVETTNDYTSRQGVLASSTGNVYGIYDLSGGAWEYVTAYYRYGNTLLNGISFASKEKDNTEWSTVYYGQDIGTNFIIGDATKETRNLNNDSSYFLANTLPFLDRGGSYANGSNAGIFFFGREDGSSKEKGGFRICLVI